MYYTIKSKSTGISPSDQIDLEEMIAATIFDFDGNELSEEDCAELGRRILKSVAEKIRPDFFEDARPRPVPRDDQSEQIVVCGREDVCPAVVLTADGQPLLVLLMPAALARTIEHGLSDLCEYYAQDVVVLDGMRFCTTLEDAESVIRSLNGDDGTQDAGDL